jgi:Family of unknown function (DUF6166)
MKYYHGRRSEHRAGVDVEKDGEFYALDPRHDLKRHSMSGFSWGFGGSGPAQLALALAADVLGDDDKAEQVYQRLKFKLIGRLPEEGWVLTEDRIREAINAVEREARRTRQ